MEQPLTMAQRYHKGCSGAQWIVSALVGLVALCLQRWQPVMGAAMRR